MSDDYRYTLTRMCLRGGQLSLTQRMLAMFPKDGPIRVVDAEKNTEFELVLEDRKRVTGLENFFQSHHLDVNDEIHIRPLEDDRFLFTAFKRNQRVSEKRLTPPSQLADRIANQGVPLSESEIRTSFPDLTKGLDVHAELAKDSRFVFRSGRWQPKSFVDSPASSENSSSIMEEPLLKDDPEPKEIKPASGFSTEDKVSRVTSYRTTPKTLKTGLTSASGFEDMASHNRAKDLLKLFGYRVDVLDSGQLLAHADLGRHTYTAYIHILPENGQLDWSTLLTRRRDTNASYAAVFGDHRDLLRLGAPAGMARATLWSWSALVRVQDLMQVVPISPYDLESHFEKDGLFEQGKERFEKTIADRVLERGVFSSVLSRLAGLRAPCVFLLDDVLDDQVSREQALKVLDNLGGAPFHMIAKIGSGEFCLRQKVAESLEHISRYALSLRERLPNRQTERLQAYADEEVADS